MSNLMKRIAISFAVLAVSVCLVGPAQALTADELQAQIVALTAQLTALQGQLGTTTTTTTTTTTVSGCAAFTRNLTIGSTGADVKCLQQFLNANGAQVSATGAGAPGYETTYFGTRTKAALAVYQAANAISPAVGFFGPITRANVNPKLGTGTGTTTTTLPAGCTSTAGYSPTTGVSCATGTTTTLPTAAGLTVSLASSTPVATTIISDGSAGVAGSQALIPVLALNFATPAGSSASVTQLILHRAGISTDSDIDNVYLYDGATKIAEMTSLSLGTVSFVNSAGLFTVAGNKEITVKFDLNKDTTSGKTLAFQLTSAADVTAGGVVINGTFPISGSVMTTANVSDFGRLTIAKQTNSASVDPGATGFEAMKMTVTSANQNIKLYKMTLIMLGSINATDIANIALYDAGTQLASVAALNADKTVTFDLSASPLTILSGVTKTITVRVDVVGGSTRTIQFSIQRTADIVAMDANYNAYIKADTALGVFAVQTSDAATVTSGNLVVTKATDSPSGNVSFNATNISAAKYNLQAVGEGVKVTQLSFSIANGTAGAAWNNVKNVRFIYDGVQVGTTTTVADNGTTYPINVNFTVPSGTTKTLEVKLDTSSYSTTGTEMVDGDSIVVTLTQGSGNGQRVNSLGTFDVPAAAKGANQIGVSSAALTAIKNTSVGALTLINGATNQRLGSFLLTAGSAEGVDVSSIVIEDGKTIDATAGTAALGTAFTNLKLMNGTTQLGTTKVTSTSDAATTTYTFYPSSFSIPAGTTVQIDVYGDILTGVSWATGEWVRLNSVTGTGKVTSTAANVASGKGGQGITLASSGTLSATLDSSSVLTSQVLMGATAQSMATWKFTANNTEDITISQLAVTNTNTTYDGNVRNLALYVNGAQVGSTVPALDGSDQAWFRGLSILVPRGGNTLVTLKADVSPYADGPTAGQYVQFGITVPATISGLSTDTVVAIGQSGAYASTSGTTASAINGYGQYPYRSLLTASLATTHTATGNARSANDKIATLTLTGSSSSDAQLTAALNNAADASTLFFGADTDATITLGTSTTAGWQVDGTSVTFTPTGGTSLTKAGYAPASAVDLSAYKYVSFWVTTTGSETAADLVFSVSEADATLTSLSGSSINLPATVAGTPVFVELALSGIGATSLYNAVTSYGLTSAAMTANGVIAIDAINFYNDSVKVNISGDLNSTAPVGAAFYLKFSGTTMATGYYTGTSATGTVTLIPSSLISVGATSAPFDLYTSTTALMATDTTASEVLSLTINQGTPASAGDFRWYDQAITATAPVTWMNPVSGILSVSAGY